MRTTVQAAFRGGPGRYSVLVHGGAGSVPTEAQALHRLGCRVAVEEARRSLESGASALDAVQRAVEVLESNPIFNAGLGAVLNVEGKVELDAGIMDGATLRAGAVCALRGYEHPIAIARAALEDGRHVLYAAHGAARFAAERGFAAVEEETLITEAARRSFLRRAAHAVEGTVGAVARALDGSVAAATSTGGTSGKRVGRVGDSPILGAGVFADRAGASSATGHGEGILRVALCCRTVDSLVRRKSPRDAASEQLAAMRARLGAEGGLIVVDARGRLGWAFTTPNMPWAAAWDGAETIDGV